VLKEGSRPGRGRSELRIISFGQQKSEVSGPEEIGAPIHGVILFRRDIALPKKAVPGEEKRELGGVERADVTYCECRRTRKTRRERGEQQGEIKQNWEGGRYSRDKGKEKG